MRGCPLVGGSIISEVPLYFQFGYNYNYSLYNLRYHNYLSIETNTFVRREVFFFLSMSSTSLQTSGLP